MVNQSYPTFWLKSHQELYSQAFLPVLFTKQIQSRIPPSLGFNCLSIQKKILKNLNQMDCFSNQSLPSNLFFVDENKKKKNNPNQKSTSNLWILKVKLKSKKKIVYQSALLKTNFFILPVFKTWIRISSNKNETLFSPEFFTFPTLIQHLIFKICEVNISDFLILLKKKKINFKPLVHFIYFDSQILVLSQSFYLLTMIKKRIRSILKLFGLEINKVLYIQNGNSFFYFWGWRFQKNRLPSFLKKNKSSWRCFITTKSLAIHKKKIKYLTKTLHQPELLILTLNKQIQKWFFDNQNCSNLNMLYDQLNYYLFKRLIKWAKRRHNNKTTKWILNRYWKKQHNRLTFYWKSKNKKVYFLLHYTFFKKFS